MKVLVLGSGAGGGFPQWNCACAQCAGVRSGEIQAKPRTQSSIAVSVDGLQWVLINASPDVGTQIRNIPALQSRPDSGLRHTPICAVVLMDSHIDHVTGLLTLREGKPLELYCTASVHEDLTHGLPILEVLKHYCGVNWHELTLSGETFSIASASGLSFTALALKGKAPPYSPHRQSPTLGDNIALLIRDEASEQTLYYAPGLANIGDAERQAMSQAHCVLVDGTFWTHDEMITAGLGKKTAADMGHMPQQQHGTEMGMIEALSKVDAKRKVLIHINNSNPILNEKSTERSVLTKHGIEVAYDGMEILL
jgi:pyrroloquinoline quinone biosynthesis protein B